MQEIRAEAQRSAAVFHRAMAEIKRLGAEFVEAYQRQMDAIRKFNSPIFRKACRRLVRDMALTEKGQPAETGYPWPRWIYFDEAPDGA